MIEFKRVTSDQVEILRKISIETFYTSFYHLNTPENYELYTAKALSTDTLLKELNHSNSDFFFGYLDQKLVCYFKLNLNINSFEQYSSDSLEIQRIYVLPEYFSKGIGALCIDFIKKFSLERDFKFIWLGVWDQNERARLFYQRHGFTQKGSHEFLLGNDRQTDLILECSLV